MRRATFQSMLLVVLLIGWSGLAMAQADNSPVSIPIPKECEAPGAAIIETSPLPNVTEALKSRKRIVILAIGGTSSSLRGPVSGGAYAIVEKHLEAIFKPLDVQIVHRGVSGELASDAAERIKTEVALLEADLVLWQIGTADAMARVPVDEFSAVVTDTVRWLKERRIDVILVGVRYAVSMVRDTSYQEMRRVVSDIAARENVLRIGRYAAEETIARIRKDKGEGPSEAEATEASYVCMAEYMARAIVSGLFARKPDASRPSPAPAPPK